MLSVLILVAQIEVVAFASEYAFESLGGIGVHGSAVCERALGQAAGAGCSDFKA